MKKKLDTRFPAARIKKIMQTDEEVGKIALATPILISKALELFLQDLCEKTHEVTVEKGAKTVSAAHLKETVTRHAAYDFLQEVLMKALQVGHDAGSDDNNGLKRTSPDADEEASDVDEEQNKRPKTEPAPTLKRVRSKPVDKAGNGGPPSLVSGGEMATSIKRAEKSGQDGEEKKPIASQGSLEKGLLRGQRKSKVDISSTEASSREEKASTSRQGQEHGPLRGQRKSKVDVGKLGTQVKQEAVQGKVEGLQQEAKLNTSKAGSSEHETSTARVNVEGTEQVCEPRKSQPRDFDLNMNLNEEPSVEDDENVNPVMGMDLNSMPEAEHPARDESGSKSDQKAGIHSPQIAINGLGNALLDVAHKMLQASHVDDDDYDCDDDGG